MSHVCRSWNPSACSACRAEQTPFTPPPYLRPYAESANTPMIILVLSEEQLMSLNAKTEIRLGGALSAARSDAWDIRYQRHYRHCPTYLWRVTIPVEYARHKIIADQPATYFKSSDEHDGLSWEPVPLYDLLPGKADRHSNTCEAWDPNRDGLCARCNSITYRLSHTPFDIPPRRCAVSFAPLSGLREFKWDEY